MRRRRWSARCLLAVSKRVLGAEHPDTLTTAGEVAVKRQIVQ
jgi:hypothetical protein